MNNLYQNLELCPVARAVTATAVLLIQILLYQVYKNVYSVDNNNKLYRYLALVFMYKYNVKYQ